MNIPTQRQRYSIYKLSLFLGLVGTGVGLILWSMKDTIVFFYTPEKLILKEKKDLEKSIRLGGIVKEGTFNKLDAQSMKFHITDGIADIPVTYSGVLPALFREGQGVVVFGKYSINKGFQATEVLAKHDEKYMPPGAIEILNKKGCWQSEVRIKSSNKKRGGRL